MNENPFRRRPFVEIGIDSWKVVVLSLAFLLLILLALFR